MHFVEVPDGEIIKIDRARCQLSINQDFAKRICLLDGWVRIFGEFQEIRYQFLPAGYTILRVVAIPQISFIPVQYNSEIFLWKVPSNILCW